MPIKYNIDDLKTELVGKSINWLTVLDVYTNSNNRTVCKCQCRCGSVKEYLLKVIRKGEIKSCGCFNKSEEYSNQCKQIYKDNPDILIQRSHKYKQWCKNNPDKIAEQALRHHEWFYSHEDIRNNNRQRMIELNVNKNKELSKINRVNSLREIVENNNIRDMIEEDDLVKLLSGSLVSSDKIKTRCPQCGNFSEHNVRDIFNISEKMLKCFRLCDKCFSTSSYESEIIDYISTFYNGTLIKNSRNIISPFELDLYYPEKKIAIEFNGDYWHSSLFKDEMYHYNKFVECHKNNITLVSIFESEWLRNKDAIKFYITDLFNDKENSLSIYKLGMNNNYPLPFKNIKCVNYNDLYYTFRDNVVYTCGYSL
jgi:hypothetical protein